MAESGDGVEFAAERERMVERDVAGRSRGAVRDERVLAAMREVPRERFVADEWRAVAYADRPLPIGHGQTISQPYIVAVMSELLEAEPGERVLEVGTGCGYQAAVLAAMGLEVYTIEIVEALAAEARENLAAAGYGEVQVRAGDGYAGWPEAAPFDGILVACAPEAVPAPLVEQLAEGGRMVVPVGEDGGVQELVVLEKEGGEVRRRSVMAVRFVPMTGEAEGGGGSGGREWGVMVVKR